MVAGLSSVIWRPDEGPTDASPLDAPGTSLTPHYACMLLVLAAIRLQGMIRDDPEETVRGPRAARALSKVIKIMEGNGLRSSRESHRPKSKNSRQRPQIVWSFTSVWDITKLIDERFGSPVLSVFDCFPCRGGQLWLEA